LAEILGLEVGQVNEGQQVGGVSVLWLMKNSDYTNYKPTLRLPVALVF